MSTRRVQRLNSLLKEIISEVVRHDLHHLPNREMMTIMSVEVTSDLSFAKVFVSVIGTPSQKEASLKTLNIASKQIAHLAMRKISLRIFPVLQFYLDEGLEKQLRIHEILEKVKPPVIPTEKVNLPEENP